MVKDARLLGFNFTKIGAEKNSDFSGKLEIKSNINIEKIEKHKTTSMKQDALKIKFNVDVDYGDLGKVEMKGNLFITADSKAMKETLLNWESQKKPTDLQVAIINIILQKTSIKAIQIEEEIGLPIHLQNLFPKINAKEKEEE